jgi:pyridoxine/pyridoxamine 5'-phosphate oxidase
MNRAELYAFIRRHKYAVQASVADGGAPQAAVVGIVATEELEIFFDTLHTSRKAQNLRRDPRIALVIGWDEEQTVQYEGVVDEPSGVDRARLKAIYFDRFPDGRDRERQPGIAYFRARPKWARYSDFRGAGPKIVEISF